MTVGSVVKQVALGSTVAVTGVLSVVGGGATAVVGGATIVKIAQAFSSPSWWDIAGMEAKGNANNTLPLLCATTALVTFITVLNYKIMKAALKEFNKPVTPPAAPVIKKVDVVVLPVDAMPIANK